MIKKILLAICVAFPMLAVAQAPKFGVVNTQEVLDAMPDVKKAASKKYEDEFGKLREQMDREYAEFQKLDPSTPEPIKQRRQQEVQALYQKMEQFQMTASEDLRRQHDTLMAPVISKVSSAISAVGKEKGLTFVFESTLPLYSGADVVTITPDVKKSLGITGTAAPAATTPAAK
ncbi:OmpH family outer membrane protein [Bacteroides acidifaciens]|uniref:OmpH family outer membrane protein n=1 Tax=Bacteroides acidifaciens TaxID=85831 RepID=UPI00242FA839|nr:OmpH family outer membrane protein [Bacteroides acidifaciens]